MNVEKIKAAIEVINAELAKAPAPAVRKKKSDSRNTRIGKYQFMFHSKTLMK